MFVGGCLVFLCIVLLLVVCGKVCFGDWSGGDGGDGDNLSSCVVLLYVGLWSSGYGIIIFVWFKDV